MTQIVPRQIYIDKRQRAQLMRATKACSMSEAELIRQAIDHQLAGSGTSLPHDLAAWERAVALMRSLLAKGPLPNRRRSWTRDELYEERESRYGRRSG